MEDNMNLDCGINNVNDKMHWLHYPKEEEIHSGRLITREEAIKEAQRVNDALREYKERWGATLMEARAEEDKVIVANFSDAKDKAFFESAMGIETKTRDGEEVEWLIDGKQVDENVQVVKKIYGHQGLASKIE